jgi:uncharacterized protein (TIGR02271 family)
MDAGELTKDEFPTLRNIPVYSADGEMIGHVGDAYYDEASGRLECVAVAADAIGFAKRVIPVRGATIDADGLRLAYGSEAVTGSPSVDDELDEQRYRGVADYYADTQQESLTRSEEELAIEKRDVEAGSVRLRKWVESEPVEVDVELKRETAHIEREQLNKPAPDVELREQTIEVPLHAEEAVVQKQTVAKERIRVDKDVEQEGQTVSDELRKERIDVEEDKP